MTAAFSDPFPSRAAIRLLIFADMLGASQAIAFVEGLSRARREGRAAVCIVEEAALAPDAAARAGPSARAVIQEVFDQTDPTAVVLSRFSLGGASEEIRAQARARALPLLAHIDDDLADLPVTAGVERYRAARHPRRAHVLHQALTEADLVMAATPALADRLARRLGHGRIGWLDTGAAGAAGPHAGPAGDGAVVVGYMGSASHDADLRMIAPALNAILSGGPRVRLELFGSIARQPAADLLPGSTVRRDAVAGDYADFRRRLAGLGWDIGLAPLHDTPYNRCKTATKWAEYAEAGFAVIASDMPVYQPIFAADAAMPARDGDWEPVLRRLIGSARVRQALVRRADALLGAQYGWDRLEAQVLGLIGGAAARVAVAEPA